MKIVKYIVLVILLLKLQGFMRPMSCAMEAQLPWKRYIEGELPLWITFVYIPGLCVDVIYYLIFICCACSFSILFYVWDVNSVSTINRPALTGKIVDFFSHYLTWTVCSFYCFLLYFAGPNWTDCYWQLFGSTTWWNCLWVGLVQTKVTAVIANYYHISSICANYWSSDQYMKTTFLCFSAWCKCHIGCLAICKAKVLIFNFFFLCNLVLMMRHSNNFWTHVTQSWIPCWSL